MNESLLAAVHRRHPDVDLVVLPPPEAPPDTDQVHGPVDDAVVDDVVLDVRARAHLLWATVAPDDVERPLATLSYGADPASVRATVRLSTRPAPGGPDGATLMARLRRTLEDAGWRVHRPPTLRRPPGQAATVERLAGRLGDLDVACSWVETPDRPPIVTLTMRSAPVLVGRERARSLVRAGVRAGGR